MRYFDTSVIVAALTIEAATNRAQAEMADAAAGRLAISDWTLTEVASALAIKLRAGQITAAERAQHQAAFNRFVERSFIVLPVAASHFRSAAMLSRDDRVALRAGTRYIWRSLPTAV